jgi:hypothetical protein
MASLSVVPAIPATVAQLPATATVPVQAPTLRTPPLMETLEKANADACRAYQEYYDEYCRRVGMRAPEPKAGQDVHDYRCETLRTLKRIALPQNHDLYKIQYRSLKDDPPAIKALEPQLLEAFVVETYNPNNVPKGELRKVDELNSFGQTTSSRFIGQESFVKLPNFGTDIQSSGGYRPGRRVKAFKTDRGLHIFTTKEGRLLK